VTGTYVHKQGKIDGTVTTRTTGTGKDAITTFTLTGRWSQAPTYQAPHDAGDFQFVLSKQGWRPYFAGKRRYGSAGAYTDGWDGTRRARLTHDSTGPGDDGLNKDEGIIDPRTGAATKPETPRGQIKDTSGNTNFEKAVAGAIAETRRQWRDFGQALVARYGLPQAQRMICALVRDNPLKDCDPATCSLDPYTPKGVPVSAAGRGAVMTRYRPTDAGPAAPAAAVCTAPAPDWNGTYSDGPHVYTLRASGSSVTGEGKWTLPGHTFAESGSTENFGSCTANGNTTTCPDATGEYHDADKSITYTAQVTLTLSDDGNTLTTSRTLTSTTVTWKPGVAPYESAVHVGATFTDTDTRIGSQ
jgi:hypothetical protein